MQKLTEKQKRFCDYYIETGNASESYKKAYNCSNDTTSRTNANKNLQKPTIKSYIGERLNKMDNERILSAEKALALLSDIGKGEIKEEVVSFSMEGETLRTYKDANLKDRIKALESIVKRQDAIEIDNKIEINSNDFTKNVIDNTVKPFENSFFDIYNHRYTHYWFKGGRGSTKSSFISLIIPFLMEKEELYNVVILRKVGNTLKKSVYNQILWALDKLEIRENFKTTTSPLEMTKINTGQKIVFLGCDDPTKVKSLKFENGYPAIVWYEEVDQFSGMEEIRNLNQSLLRGGDKFWAFYSFNPPKSKNNWANEEVLIDQNNKKVYHSTYLDVPQEWLGELFFIEAEHLKNKNEMSYRHEYLGEATGTGGSVFENVTIREITDDEINGMGSFNYSIDFGFSIDPTAFIKAHYHNGKLYIVDEIYEQKLSIRSLSERLKLKGVKNELVICDSAEPRSIADLRDNGINAMPVKKYPDSVNNGMKWLQDLDEIIIDARRTPGTAKEFIGYEYERNREGQFISKYPDKDNHAIDSCRYNCSFLIQQKRGKLDYAN